MSLFRKEALDYQQEKFWGDAVILTPPSYVWLTWFFVFMVGVGLLFLNIGEFSKKQSVRGFVAPLHGYIKIRASDSGELNQLLVKERESVKKGQLLAVITRTQTPENDVYYQLLHENSLQKNFIEKNGEHTKELSLLQQKKINDESEALKSDIDALKRNNALSKNKMDLINDQNKRIKTLFDKGMASKIELDKSRHELLSAEQDLVQVEQQIKRKEKQLNEMAELLAENREKTEQALSEFSSRLSSLNEKSLTINSNRSINIVSPVEGIVTQLVLEKGESINSGDLLFDIVEANDEMRVTLLLPPHAMGFVEKNQTVKIKLDAYPYQKFGVIKGIIDEMSLVSKIPSRLETPFNVQESMYEAKVKLSNEPFLVKKNHKIEEVVNLQYGMTLHADIIFDKRTLIEWILDPLLSLR